MTNDEFTALLKNDPVAKQIYMGFIQEALKQFSDKQEKDEIAHFTRWVEKRSQQTVEDVIEHLTRKTTPMNDYESNLYPSYEWAASRRKRKERLEERLGGLAAKWKQGYERYELLRTLTPRKFRSLWEHCLVTDKRFDDEVDEMVKDREYIRQMKTRKTAS